MSCSDRQYLEIIKNILLENLFWLCSSHQTTLQPSESTACAGFAASVSFKLSWLSKTLTIKRPIPGPLTRNHKTMDVSRTKPKAHVTWQYVGILSEFIPADRSLSSSKGRKVMKRQVSVSVSVSSPTSNSCFISNPDSSAHNSWTQHGLYRSHFKETRQTSTNPQFYQVWSGLIWNNTCKIDLKTWSVTDPIVGGLRPRLEKHPQMEYLVSQAQTTIRWLAGCSKWLVLLWADHRKAKNFQLQSNLHRAISVLEYQLVTHSCKDLHFPLLCLPRIVCKPQAGLSRGSEKSGPPKTCSREKQISAGIHPCILDWLKKLENVAPTFSLCVLTFAHVLQEQPSLKIEKVFMIAHLWSVQWFIVAFMGATSYFRYHDICFQKNNTPTLL